jgi:two-component system response regulator PilR (NtrC family)
VTKLFTTREHWAAVNEDFPFEASSGKAEAHNMTSVEQVLVIAPESEHHEKINVAMHRCGLSSFSCRKLDEARKFLAKQKFSVVLCHDTLPDGDFRDVVAAVKPTPVVVLSRFAEWDHYIAALRAGAFDYIACPPDLAETERIMRSAIGNAIRGDRSASSAP